VDKYPTWKDNTIKPEPVRVVGEDVVPTQEKYTLNTEALEAIKARLLTNNGLMAKSQAKSHLCLVRLPRRAKCVSAQCSAS
jgi:hypothetical protein